MNRLACPADDVPTPPEAMADPPEERLARRAMPRERLAALGVAGLTDAELISLLLGSGVEGRSAIRLGRMLARHHPSELGHWPLGRWLLAVRADSR